MKEYRYINQSFEKFLELLNEIPYKITEPLEEGKKGYVLTTDGDGNRTWTNGSVPINCLYTYNYLSEFNTDEDKANVRKNLDILSKSEILELLKKLDIIKIDEENNLLKITATSGNVYVASVEKLDTPTAPRITVSTTTTQAQITITASTGTIYYTTDGTDPTTASTKYTSQITLNASTDLESTEYVIKAIAVKNGLVSEIKTSDTITLYRLIATPIITASGDVYDTSRTITITCSTSDVKIQYSIDGDSLIDYDNTNKPVLNGTCLVKVVVTKDNWVSNSTLTTITVGTLSMWWGLITSSSSAPSTDAQVKALGNQIKAASLPQSTSKITDTALKKVVFAYKNSLSDLTSIKDDNGTEYLDQFTKTTTTNYKVYTLNSAANQNGMTYTFK